MGYDLLFRKANTVHTFLIDYLDERSEYSHTVKSRRDQIDHEKLCGKVAKGLDYFSKEKTFGRVYAGGFFRERLAYKFGKVQSKVPKDDVKRATSKLIQQHSKDKRLYRGAYGHHCIISMRSELMKEIEDQGGCIDEALSRALKNSMTSFQKQFHPNDKIGFAFGIHHDTQHRHAHIFIHNRTEKGDHVAMSNPLKGLYDPKPRLNQVGFMKEQMEIEGKKILRDLKKPRLKQQHKIRRALTDKPGYDFNDLLKVEEDLNKTWTDIKDVNAEKISIKRSYEDIQKKLLYDCDMKKESISKLFEMANNVKTFNQRTKDFRDMNYKLFQSPVSRTILDMSRLFIRHRSDIIYENINHLSKRRKEQFKILSEIKAKYENVITELNSEKKVALNKAESLTKDHNKLLKALPLLQKISSSPDKKNVYKKALQVFKKNQDFEGFYSSLKSISNNRPHVKSRGQSHEQKRRQHI
jgi:hypothetical protein